RDRGGHAGRGTCRRRAGGAVRHVASGDRRPGGQLLQVLVSLHDVTPAHRARLDRAEALLAGAGVNRVAYLVVPDYHRGHAIADDRAFRDWCARPRPFSVEWVLHGYYHLDDRHAASGAREWLARRLMTAGEGEFLTLDADRQRERLRRGRQAVEAATGATPRAFVAPAWLFNGTLVRTLSDEGFRYTEDHWHIVDVARGVSHACPAITWATRTFVRRIG